MKNKQFFIECFILLLILLLSSGHSCYANNLNITNVTLTERNPSAGTVVVEFDVSWENSWRTKINHDAVWLTVRLYKSTVTPTNKILSPLTESGLNPQGIYTGSTSQVELYVPADKWGVFIRPAAYGKFSTITAEAVQLTIDYGTAGFSSSDDVYVSLMGVEMVLVPSGTFFAGDFDSSTAALDQGTADSDPWVISNDLMINVTNPSNNGYRYVSNNNPGEDPTGATFTISSAFPVGYYAFYVMKYEITEGQWIEFINALPSNSARLNRDITDSAHKNTDSVINRNTVTCSGSPLSCSSSRPNRSLSFITWMDLASFLDWMALRPMSELEFEKLSRGPLLAETSEFAWGDTNITSATTISAGDEVGNETITTTGANAHFNNMTLTGGDTGYGTGYTQGPLRGGIFATGQSTRETSGATYYGVLDVSGNLRERVVTFGNASGRLFDGSHGDGDLTTVSGYEGNATNSDWPGMDTNTARGVTGANGSGFRGGAWDSQSSGDLLRVSDRTEAALSTTSAFNNAGGRGVRTYEGE
ncbi:MAG: formylglycine-generating enzyme family protein [Candidatus Omnitrophica bacterium]|nr:formylglycine-generating enzyme family protein [Candidatus Omnitrophota bacterium]